MEPQLMVVGGGPVGSTVAALASGLQTTVVEEHAAIGTPVQCTGLVHPRVVEMADAREAVINIISGFKLFLPGGGMVEVPSDEPKATVIDRQLFDQILSRRAAADGCDVLTGHRFCGLSRSGGNVKVRLEGPGGESFMRSPLLVGADGYKSLVAREAGLGPCREVVRGIQVDLDVKLDDQSKVEVYIGKSVAPGFFGWVLPCGERTRVGLCVSSGNGPPSRHLAALLERRGLDRIPRDRLFSGAIPIGPPDRTVADNIMLVGDAAGMTKPLSGGGIFTGLQAARLAARTAMNAIEENDTSEKFLFSYEEEWRAAIGKELERGALIRKVYLGMSDKKLDQLGRMIDRDDVKEVMAAGDIDYPSKLASPMLRALPSLVKFSPSVIGTLIRREQRI